MNSTPDVEYIMSPNVSVKKTPLIVLFLCVCGVGISVGGFFGWLAGAKGPLDRGDLGGFVFGATSGFLAAALWCRFIVPKIVKAKRPHKDIITYGLKWGGFVGVVAGLIVFTWLLLNIAKGRPNTAYSPRAVIWYIVAGTVGGGVGMIAGLLCGWIAYITARLALPLPPLKPRFYHQDQITNLTEDKPASSASMRNTVNTH